MKQGQSRSARRIVVTLPAGILQDIDWLADLEEMTRGELIVEAVKRFLKPHLAIRKQVKQAARKKGKIYVPLDTAAETIPSLKNELRKTRKVTKAISESTKDFKTGRYEEP
jgi:metal-responsive CopG/Arc/MetJ family transcriptional regulator